MTTFDCMKIWYCSISFISLQWFKKTIGRFEKLRLRISKNCLDWFSHFQLLFIMFSPHEWIAGAVFVLCSKEKRDEKPAFSAMQDKTAKTYSNTPKSVREFWQESISCRHPHCFPASGKGGKNQHELSGKKWKTVKAEKLNNWIKVFGECHKKFCLTADTSAF